MNEHSKEVKPIYLSLKRLSDSIAPKSGYYVNAHVAANYERQLDELAGLLGEKYLNYRVSGVVDRGGMSGQYDSAEFLQMISQVLGLLEGQFDFEDSKSSPAAIVSIDNSNRNEIRISYKSIQQVVSEITDPEIKEKLSELEEALLAPQPDQSKVKDSLLWLASRSWEVFLSVLPYILERLGHGH